MAVLCAALATLTLVAACRPAEVPSVEAPRPVRTVTIDQRASGDILALTGTVRAATEVNLAFRIDGRLIERSVNVGDTVRRGQLLARLDPHNETSSLQAARAQLVAARAQQADARTNLERMRDLVSDDSVSRASFEQAGVLQQTALAQVETARSQVTLAESRLADTRLLADVAGVVTAQGAEPGEVVAAGRMVVQIARAGGRDGVFDVPAQAKDSVLANPEITVSLTIDPKVAAAGRVREVSPQADPVTGTFLIRVKLIDPPAAMRLGSTVTMRMSTSSAAGYAIPASALLRSDRLPAVWLVDPKTATVSLRTVGVQAFDASTVVVASGLAPGDVVVTAGIHALRPGQKVRLLEAKP
jgi:RND family efflux transporter MFP subunit